MADEKDLKVGVLTIGEVFKLLNLSKENEKNLGDFKLKIPPYQRPYTWEVENVRVLIEDIKEALNQNNGQYLIGNVIFHEEDNNQEDNNLNIVDGQQRITTLALMFHAFDNNIENFLNQTVDINSQKALKKNFSFLKNQKFTNEFIEYLKENVIITYTATSRLDEAFILFNSQNTRGKALDDKDLLKGHHLRFIKRLPQQIKCAKEFEKAEQDESQSLSNVLELLAIIKKASKSELKGDDLVSIDLYSEFKSEFEQNDIKFNKYHSDFTAITSIQGGSAFFSYLEKYANFYKDLRLDPAFTCYDNLYGAGNVFLRKVYKAIILFYRDKFYDDDYFVEKYLQILLLDFRIKTSSVLKQSVQKEFDKWIKEIAFSSNVAVLKKKLEKYVLNNVLEINYIDKDKDKDKEYAGAKGNFINASYFKDEIQKEYKKESK